MPTYTAPARDTRFIVNEVLKLESYGNLPGFAEQMAALTPEVVRLALLGKVVTGGDAVSLLPQDVEPLPGLDVGTAPTVAHAMAAIAIKP